MSRIDHAAEAAEWIADAPHALHGTSGEQQSTDRAVVCALLAQAHATLALAEQQRIANLVALAQGSDGAFSVVTRDLAYLSIASGGPDGAPHPDIAAALGIEAAS